MLNRTIFYVLALMVGWGLASPLGSNLARASAGGSEEALFAAQYGSIYLLDHREPVTRKWTVGAEYLRQFNNPYLDIQGLTLTVARDVGAFFSVGAQVTRYMTSQTETANAVGAALAVHGVFQSITTPEWSAFVTGSVAPISGRLNLLSAVALPFDLRLTLGAGARREFAGHNNAAALLWAISPRAMVSRWLGFDLSLGQQIGGIGGDGVVANFDARFGTFVRF